MHWLLAVIVHGLVQQLCPPVGAAQMMRSLAHRCKNVSDVAFLVFYPCAQEDAASYGVERLEQCDLLSLAAIELAVERINANGDVLPEGCKLRTISVESKKQHDDHEVYPTDKVLMVRSCICFHIGRY